MMIDIELRLAGSLFRELDIGAIDQGIFHKQSTGNSSRGERLVTSLLPVSFLNLFVQDLLPLIWIFYILWPFEQRPLNLAARISVDISRLNHKPTIFVLYDFFLGWWLFHVLVVLVLRVQTGR
jgi:hypothetical protein